MVKRRKTREYGFEPGVEPRGGKQGHEKKEKARRSSVKATTGLLRALGTYYARHGTTKTGKCNGKTAVIGVTTKFKGGRHRHVQGTTSRRKLGHLLGIRRHETQLGKRKKGTDYTSISQKGTYPQKHKFGLVIRNEKEIGGPKSARHGVPVIVRNTKNRSRNKKCASTWRGKELALSSKDSSARDMGKNRRGTSTERKTPVKTGIKNESSVDLGGKRESQR